MLASTKNRVEKRKARAFPIALASAALLAALGSVAMAAGANVSFSGTVGSVENGIGLSGDQTITTTTVAFAAVRFEIYNPGTTGKNLNLRAFDADFIPVDDVRLAPQVQLAAGQSEQFIAFVPVEPGAKRRFRICAAHQTDRHCGKFIAQRLP